MLKQNLQELRLGGRTRTFLQNRWSLAEPGHRLVAESSGRQRGKKSRKGESTRHSYPGQGGNGKQLVQSDQELPQKILQLLVKL